MCYRVTAPQIGTYSEPVYRTGFEVYPKREFWEFNF